MLASAMKTFITLWKLEVSSRLPLLRRDLQEAVYLPPRIAYTLYNALILVYWTAIAAGSIAWLTCRFTYLLGVSTRQLILPKQEPLQLKGKNPPVQAIQTSTATAPLPTAKPSLQASTATTPVPTAIPTIQAPPGLTPVASAPLAVVEKIALSELTTTAAQKVKAANPDRVVLARPWGRGWRIAVLEPEEAMTVQRPWKLVVRS
ncbi:hypothetical protein H6F50_04740 [Coleofasciculus sp. FACHB-712]|uniref:hypothetical protein n=1 Tax=Coleofasciculus sp. FACHB-712 TaxID=2692789 RepID=UPI001681EAF0|nr:hypothetical protein [Coleofasciculus sp. FACHB-712]MBD1941669.1 hypothetical protein [Coleofasciculus sp. FACHB-712]